MLGIARYRRKQVVKQMKNESLILLVQQDIETLQSLGNLLKMHNDVMFATSGQAGLHMAKRNKPDLIVIDSEISGPGAIDFCTEIMASRDTQNCNLMITTTSYSSELELTALQKGIMDYLVKPLENPAAIAKINSHAKFSRHRNRLQSLAEKDGLTGVYNRRYFDSHARKEIKRHYRQQHPLSLALLDIDFFKAYNDHYGHLQGDSCLLEISQALANSSRRPGEFVARYGGEEFAVVLPNTGAEDAQKYGKWICERVHSLAIPHAGSKLTPFVSLSAGVVSVIPGPQTSLENLIVTADSALYSAKEAGRNQYKVSTIYQESIQEVI